MSGTFNITGTLKKMESELLDPIEYRLPIGDERVPISELIGKSVWMRHTGNIFCIHCNRKTKKSFSQGHCYPCFKKLASCDMCIMKPEQCHFSLGTCREPEWGEKFCNDYHIVYLANSSGLKVGITRNTQIPTRWIDQGASQALPVFRVATRHHSGLVEIILAKKVADKTNWRAMLKGEPEAVDLIARRDELLAECQDDLAALADQLGAEQDAIMEPLGGPVVDINFPVQQYPVKVSSFNFDKTPEVEGTLVGIKGQYLIFETGVINIRKFTAYEIELKSAG